MSGAASGLAAALPHVTASLNGVALVLMAGGFVLVRNGRRDLHRSFMLAAVAASAFWALWRPRRAPMPSSEAMRPALPSVARIRSAPAV